MNRRPAASAILGLFLAVGISACGSPSSSSTKPTSPPPITPTTVPFVPGPLSVGVLPATSPRVLSKKVPIINIHLSVHGLHFDLKGMGKKATDKHGHVQVYLDHVPASAYTAGAPTAVIGTAAAPVFSVGFTPQWVAGHKGKHILMIALAQNNNVLFKGVKPASFKITIK